MPEVDHVASCEEGAAREDRTHGRARHEQAMPKGHYELSRRRPGLAKKLARKGQWSFSEGRGLRDQHFKADLRPVGSAAVLVRKGLFKAIKRGPSLGGHRHHRPFVPEGHKLAPARC